MNVKINFIEKEVVTIKEEPTSVSIELSLYQAQFLREILAEGILKTDFDDIKNQLDKSGFSYSVTSLFCDTKPILKAHYADIVKTQLAHSLNLINMKNKV